MKIGNGSIYLPAILLVAALICAGCKKKEESLSPPPPKPAAKPKPVQKQATSAKVAGMAEQPLEFVNRKDPFKPFAAEPVAQPQPKQAAVTRRGDLLPIQSYDVNRFTVSGIIAGFKENTALIIDPAGKGYVVREGMLIGTNDGRISRITPSSIEVVETYRDDNNRIKKRTIVLSLSKKK